MATNHFIHSNNKDLNNIQSSSNKFSSDSFADDEFDDFQSAPSIPKADPNQYRSHSSTSNPTLGLKYDGPHHLHNGGGIAKTTTFTTTTTTTPVHNYPQPPLPKITGQFNSSGSVGTGSKNKNNVKQSIVGSRLANYDLNSSPRMNNQQQQQQQAQQQHHHHQTMTPVMQPFYVPNNSVIDSSKIMSTTHGGDNLLIGEEDKYSALRVLVDQIPNSSSSSTNASHQPNDTLMTSNSNNITATATTLLNPHNSVSHVDGNGIEHKISLCDDVLRVVKTETTATTTPDKSSSSSFDFGEFQSFSLENANNTYESFPSYPSQPPPLSMNSHHQNKNGNNNNNFGFSTAIGASQPTQNLFDFDSNHHNHGDFTDFRQHVPTIIPQQLPIATNEFKGLQSHSHTIATNATALPIQHEEQNSDFGDFVSCFNNNNNNNNNSNSNNINNFSYSEKNVTSKADSNNTIVVPASPKIFVKSTDLHKKSSATASTFTSKSSKKPTQSAAAPKISLNRIAKASNILIDSPTFPKANTDTRQNPLHSSDINDDFGYYPGSSRNSKEPPPISSFDLMTSEGFDLTSPYCDSSININNNNNYDDVINKLEKVDFGAPLKTTRIDNSISTLDILDVDDDDDDFGDFNEFTVTNQDPSSNNTTESAMKPNNNLDLLPFHKQKVQCTAETQSLSSLDLGNYLESEEIKNKGLGENEQVSPDSCEILAFESYISKDSLNIHGNPSLSQSPIIQTGHNFQANTEEVDDRLKYSEDKYKCFKDEIENEKELKSSQWIQCLTTCLRLISDAQNILNSASSSEVVREIISTEKGYAYIESLTEVYIVACRIHSSSNKFGAGLQVKQLFDEIMMAWESLTPFFLGTPVMDKINSEEDWRERSGSKVCGVCLINSEEYNEESDLLDYGGNLYHTNCANLWINNIDTILPSYYNVSMM